MPVCILSTAFLIYQRTAKVIDAIRLEPARETDKEYFRGLNRRCYEPVILRQFGAWHDDQQNQSFETKWPTNNFSKVIVNNELIGGIWFDEHPDYRQLREIQIEPSYQGQGFGTRLVKQALSQTDRPIRLRVLFENEARHLYDRLGFTIIDQNEHQYIMEWKPK